jgi:hypothetical protein
MPFGTRGVERTINVKKVRKSVKMESRELRKESEKDQRECRPVRNALPLRSFALRGMVRLG